MKAKRETIEKAKRGIYNYLLKSNEGLTRDMIVRGARPLKIGGRDTYFRLSFGPIDSYVASVALQELREEGKIYVEKIGGEGKELFLAVSSLPRIMSLRVFDTAKKLKDGVVSRYTKDGEWVESKISSTVSRYPPHHFSAYLGYNTLKRDEKSETRPSGWEIEYEPWERVDARKSTISGDVALDLSIINARFPKYDSEYDELNLKGKFRRKKGREARVFGLGSYRRYLDKIARDMQEIAARTQTLDAFSKVIVSVGEGKRKKAMDIWYCLKRYPEIPNKEYTEIVTLMGKYFEKVAEKDKVHWQQKKHEFLTYMDRRINELLRESRLFGEC